MSEDDLQGIQTNLNGLSSNQKKITHVLQQSLTIINSTRLAIKENRQKIDEILSALVTLTQQLRNISTSLEKQVHKLDYFVNANLRVSRAVQEVQAMTSEVCSHVEHLYLQLNALALGHLTPSIMAPYELKDLLLAIKTKLPQKLRLPGDPKRTYGHSINFLDVPLPQ